MSLQRLSSITTTRPPAPPAAGAAPIAAPLDSPRHKLASPLILALILLVAGLLRLYRLEAWPVFVDEDNYTQAALEMLRLPWPEAFWRSSQPPTLKPPLAFLVHQLLIPTVGDPVVAGRLLPALSGLATTALTFLLGRRLANNAGGLAAASLYALSPAAVLHERM